MFGGDPLLLLPLSLLQPPSAELFHYDSTNAVNWGMRGEVPRGWGTAWAGDPVDMGPDAVGLPTPLQAALENGVQAGGSKEETGGSHSSGGGSWQWSGQCASCLSCLFLSPHRVQGKMLCQTEMRVPPRGSPRDMPVCPQPFRRKPCPLPTVPCLPPLLSPT